MLNLHEYMGTRRRGHQRFLVYVYIKVLIRHQRMGLDCVGVEREKRHDIESKCWCRYAMRKDGHVCVCERERE